MLKQLDILCMKCQGWSRFTNVFGKLAAKAATAIEKVMDRLEP